MVKLLTYILLFSTCSFTSDQEIAVEESMPVSAEKTLIVYLSRTNNTKAIAELIQKNIGGDLVALELEKPYPENYEAIVKQVAEENETGFLPQIRTKINLNNYDTIFLGFPTWGMQLPPPIKSFLHKNDLAGKTVIPFNTNAGYGVGSSFSTVKELCANSIVLKGFSIKGGVERDGIYLVFKGDKKAEAERKVKSWLKRINTLIIKD